MAKRALFLFVGLVLLLGLIPACAGVATPTPIPTPTQPTTPKPTATPTPAVTPTPAATTTPATTPTPTAKPIVLKWVTVDAKEAGIHAGLLWMADEITKRTNGRVKFEFYWSGTLVKPADINAGVGSGLVDGGTVYVPYTPAKYPLSTVGSLLYNTASWQVGGLAWEETVRTVPAIQAEMKANNIKFLTAVGSPEFNLQLKDPIKTVADLKGKKLRTTGDVLPKVFEAVGATPVAMVSAEVYEALQRGTIDGMFGYESTSYAWKWYEVCKYQVQTHFGTIVGSYLGMNLDVWNKISPADQKIIEEVASGQVVQLQKGYDAEIGRILIEMKAKGFTYIELSAADLATMKAAAMPLWDKWVTDTNAKGLPGTEVMAAWKAALAKYEKQVTGK